MRRACIDASVMAKWVFLENHSDDARLLLKSYQKSSFEFVAPEHNIIECANVVLHKRIHNSIDDITVIRAINTLAKIPIRQIHVKTLLWRIIEIAELINESAWDAAYLAVAEAEGCVFWTADQVLAKRARKHFSFIRLLGKDNPEMDMNHDNSD